MDFRTYRKQRGWSLDDAAKFLGLANGSAVWKHEEGRTMPKPPVLDSYLKLTDGAVRAEDFTASWKRHRRLLEQVARDKAA